MGLRDFNRTILLPMRVWDAPTRLFHWILVALVLTSYVSAEADWIQIHLVSGQLVLALLLFRLAWGFVGSETAQFRHFLGNPVHALQHLSHFRRREPDTQVGHNEAGGWVVLIMLVLLTVQVVSGLFSGARHRPGSVAGPLAKYLADPTAQFARFVHDANFNLLVAVVGLHVAAILAYALVKKHDLVRPMITGVKRLPATTRQPRMASPVLAGLVAGLAGVAVWLLVTLL